MKVPEGFRMGYVLLAVFAILFFQTDTAAQKRGDEQAASSFYRWYIGELNAKRFPIDMNRLVLLDKISGRMGEWLYSTEYEYDGTDVFLDSRDWDETWAKGVTAVTLRSIEDTAEVKVTLKPTKNSKSELGLHVLHVKMVKEGGTWRIDRVENRKLI